MSLRHWINVGLVTAGLGSVAGSAFGQDVVEFRTVQRKAVQTGDVILAQPAPAQPPQPPPGGPAANPGQPAPGAPVQPMPGANPMGEGPKVTKRTDVMPAPPNAQELEVIPDANGKVEFSFHGQPWPNVLNWFATVSKLSLDWQELPADYLNLTTQRAYTLDETYDLLNRHLLMRGFTMLRGEGMLTVVEVKKINPAMVPRATPEELGKRLPHEFVKVSFKLNWLLSDQAVTEFKPYASPNGTLTGLKNTNVLEVMDTVSNIRDIAKALEHEQSVSGQETLVKEFQLKNVRAHEVLPMLRELLNLPPINASGNLDQNGAMMLQQSMMQQFQQMQQMIQQMGQQNAQGKGARKDPKLVVNDLKNSILVHAEPDAIALIEKTIKAVDLPRQNEESALSNMMHVYRLSSVDPDALISILKEVGNLSPRTKLRADRDGKQLIVYGDVEDQFVVSGLVKRLDGSSRTFEVIQLRRVDAVEVAGTIQYMFGAEEDQNKRNNRYGPYFFGGWDGGGGNSVTKDARPFRIDADEERNRLLLWANPAEMQSIQNLLIKMGEIPPEEGNPNTMRVIELDSDEAAEEVLERIRQLWPDAEPNELDIRKRPRKPSPQNEESPQSDHTTLNLPRKAAGEKAMATVLRLTALQAKGDTGEPAGDGKQPGSKSSGGGSAADNGGSQKASAEHINPEDQQADADSEFARPPVRRSRSEGNSARAKIVIQQGPDGKLIVTSPDARALDKLEDMISEFTPPRSDLVVFQLRPTTWAFGVESTLKDLFKEDMEENKGRNNPFYWDYGYFPGSQNTERKPPRLSKRRPLKITSDRDTATILVQGASAAQLKMIKEVIDIMDRPQSSDPQARRITKTFQVKYSNAKVIAEAVKDVYRDLLSENDKALQDPNQNKQSRPVERSYTYIYGSGDEEGDKQSPIKFKGLISMGVDEISNTLIVSTSDGLMENVGELINALDEAAKPTSTMQMVQVNQRLNADLLQQRLEKLLNKPQQAQPQPQPGQQPGQPNANQNQQPNQTPAVQESTTVIRN